jgi:LysR family hydrogen peroxide-inducible transcriptional activator
VAKNERAYRLGSIETFMRMVENGKGVTFIPELATLQLTDSQKDLVRPFAIPAPTRHIVMLTSKSFIRKTLLDLIIEEIKKAVPQKMLQLQKDEQKV